MASMCPLEIYSVYVNCHISFYLLLNQQVKVIDLSYIFRIIRRTYNPLIFSKIKSAPYNVVRLMYGSS